MQNGSVKRQDKSDPSVCRRLPSRTSPNPLLPVSARLPADRFATADRFSEALTGPAAAPAAEVSTATRSTARRNLIAYAAIDAFADEPLPADSPLRDVADKIMMSPHMVSSNQASGLGPGYRWATDAVLQALGGQVPNNVFNPEVIDRWMERFGGSSVLTANEPVPDHPGYGPPDP